MTRRERVLEHLAANPGLTAWEIAKVLSGQRGGAYGRLLVDMQRKGQILRGTVLREGRPVTMWSIAPPGTKPVNIPDPDRENKRRRDREATRRRRARARGEDPGLATTKYTGRRLNLPVAAIGLDDWRAQAECRSEDPELFFASDPSDITKAQQVCARCPVTAQCHARAEANGEQYGIWAGIDRDERHAEQIAS